CRAGARCAVVAGAPETPWQSGRLPPIARRKYLVNQSLVASEGQPANPLHVGRLAGTLLLVWRTTPPDPAKGVSCQTGSDGSRPEATAVPGCPRFLQTRLTLCRYN